MDNINKPTPDVDATVNVNHTPAAAPAAPAVPAAPAAPATPDAPAAPAAPAAPVPNAASAPAAGPRPTPYGAPAPRPYGAPPQPYGAPPRPYGVPGMYGAPGMPVRPASAPSKAPRILTLIFISLGLIFLLMPYTDFRDYTLIDIVDYAGNEASTITLFALILMFVGSVLGIVGSILMLVNKQAGKVLAMVGCLMYGITTTAYFIYFVSDSGQDPYVGAIFTLMTGIAVVIFACVSQVPTVVRVPAGSMPRPPYRPY